MVDFYMESFSEAMPYLPRPRSLCRTSNSYVVPILGIEVSVGPLPEGPL